MRYLIEVEVNVEHLHKYKAAEVDDYQAEEQSIPDLIIQEMAWVHQSGISVTAIKEIESEVTGEYKIPETVEKLGIEISEIINQDGEDKTDGQCIDEIINLLDKYELYKKRI